MKIYPQIFKLFVNSSCFAILLFSVISFSQSIVISAPSLGFTQACASSGFNTYNLSFTFFPAANLQPTNQFHIELSDPNGSFDSPQVIGTVTSASSPVNASFSFPNNTAGQAYRIRIRSTAPIATSPASTSFAAYYAIHNQPFSIHNNVGTATVCEGGSFSLQVDDTGTPASPLYYPNLTYKWYRNFAVVPGATGPSLNITESGSYYVIVDYGSCVMNSYSNMVSVNVVEGFTLTVSTEDPGEFICSGGTKNLISSQQDPSYQYQWYLNSQPISGANQPNYSAQEGGVYHLVVTVGSCTFVSNDIMLEEIELNVFWDVDPVEVLIPGETLTVNSVDDALNPTYQWYRNGNPISGAVQSSYTINQAGIYTLAVTENQGCILTEELTFEVVIPTHYDIIITNGLDFEDCINETASLTLAGFTAIYQSEVFDIINNSYGYTYQWFKDGNPISGAISTQLDITAEMGSGNYHLEITIPGYPDPFSSNVIEVNLGIQGPVTIVSDDTYCNETTSVTLESSLIEPVYSYQWSLNNSILPGETNPTLVTNLPGEYRVTLFSGTCSLLSESFFLEEATGNLSIVGTDFDILIPGESRLIETTTTLSNPSYQWYLDGDEIPGATSDNYTATQAGIYTVEAIQTIPCQITLTDTITLAYPDSFDAIIEADAYQSCSSDATVLFIASLSAETAFGTFPVNFSNPAYLYQWYLDGNPVPGATHIFLSLDSPEQNGSYHLVITIPDFEPIVSNTLTIFLSVPQPVVSVSGSLCEGGDPVTLISDITNPSFNYTWYKDGDPIPGANNSQFTTDETGSYYLEISVNSCSSTSNSVQIEQNSITASIINPNPSLILPGGTLTLTSSTNASQPSYQWFLNGNPVSGATQSTYVANVAGNYTIAISQDEGCIAYQEASIAVVLPDSFTATIAAATPYSPCQNTQATIQLSEFTAHWINGSVPVSPTDYGYTYHWYYENTLVSSSPSPSLTITDPQQSGLYHLEISLPGFPNIITDAVLIELRIEDPVITVTGVLCEGGDPVVISSNTNDPDYDYVWTHNGIIMENETQPQLNTQQTGSYQLWVYYGSCNVSSNTVTVEESDFLFSLNAPETVVLIPGTSITLTTSTTAVNPEYQWFRNGILLTGETGSSLVVTQDGNYSVTVLENEGCQITKEEEVNVVYPDSFVLTIAPIPSYTPCESTQTTLVVTDFSAYTIQGVIPIANNNAGYNYNWFHNGTLVQSSTTTTLTVNGTDSNGFYHLEIVIPDYDTIVSNTVEIILGESTPLVIQSSGSFCDGDGTVLLSSNYSGADYDYMWYNASAETLLGIEETLEITEPGSYYLVILHNNCMYTSNIITVYDVDPDAVTLNPSDSVISLFQGSSQVVSASGADTYQWFLNGQLISTGASITVNEEGTYTLVASIGNCTLEKEFQVIIEENTNVVIPNVISPNGDGINDRWAIPAKYTNKETVEIVIYSSKGNVVFRARNYQNNWPEMSSFSYSKKEPVFYYTIMENEDIIKRGTITVIE